MTDNTIQDLRSFYDHEDFKHLWLRIATHIKIRKSDQLDHLREFLNLPNELQDEIKNKMNTIQNDYNIFSNEKYISNSHVILSTNEKEQWIAIFQDSRPSINLITLFIRIGIGIGTIFFIWNVLKYLNYIQEPTYDNNLQSQIHNSSKSINIFDNVASYIWNNFFGMIVSTLPLILALYANQNWLSSRDIKYSKLVEACMLKKLESVSNRND
jgi:hypothetical protein